MSGWTPKEPKAECSISLEELLKLMLVAGGEYQRIAELIFRTKKRLETSAKSKIEDKRPTFDAKYGEAFLTFEGAPVGVLMQNLSRSDEATRKYSLFVPDNEPWNRLYNRIACKVIANAMEER